jgi:hypothetical protein
MQLHTDPLWMGNRAECKAFSLLKSEKFEENTSQSVELKRYQELGGNNEIFERKRVENDLKKSDIADVDTVNVLLKTQTTSCSSKSTSKNFSGISSQDVELKHSQTLERNNEIVERKLVEKDLKKPDVADVDTENALLEAQTTSCSSEFISENFLGNTSQNVELKHSQILKENNEIVERKLVDNDLKKPNVADVDTENASFKTRMDSCSNKSILRIHVDTSPSENKNHASKVASTAGLNKAKTSKSNVSTQSVADLVHHVEQSMKEWMTIDSLRFIIGEQAVTNLLRDKGRTFESIVGVKNDPLLFDRYNALCRKLKLLEIGEEKKSEEPTEFEPPSKPLPDFKALKERTEEIEIKVRAFYRGDQKVSFAVTENELDTVATEEPKPIVLPAIHHHAHNSIRRNIVLNKLKFV